MPQRLLVTESNHTNKQVQHLQHSAAEFHELQDLVMSTEPGADLCLQYEALIFSSEEIARFVRHVHQVPKCVRAVSVAGEIEIVLDSGADCSVLPRSFAEVGQDAGGNGGEFEDAQGNPLAVAGVRVADIDIGNFTFRDKFIVSDVKVPLIALGRCTAQDGAWFLETGLEPASQDFALRMANHGRRCGVGSNLCALPAGLDPCQPWRLLP